MPVVYGYPNHIAIVLAAIGCELRQCPIVTEPSRHFKIECIPDIKSLGHRQEINIDALRASVA